MAGVDALSAELVALIVAWLSPEDILSARCVCRLWRALCEQVIGDRARHDGPFVSFEPAWRLSRHVDAWLRPPGACALPLYEVRLHPIIADASIASSSFAFGRSPLLAPRCLAKITHLNIATRMPWPPALLNPRVLPRLRCLDVNRENGPALAAGMQGAPWPRIDTLRLVGIVDRVGARALFPSCRHLLLNRQPVARFAPYWEAWPLQSLECHGSEVVLRDLPTSLRELTLSYVCPPEREHLADDVDADATDADAEIVANADDFWPEFVGEDPGITQLLRWPALEMLEATSVEKTDRIGLETPNLRRLVQSHFGPRLRKSLLTRVESVRLSHLIVSDVGWLAAQPLTTLALDMVTLRNLDFLADCPAIETLSMRALKMPQCTAPFAALPRLRRLTIEMNRDLITNLDDIGLLARLETLSLLYVPGLRSVAWLSGLGALTELTLHELFKLESFYGVQHAAALKWLNIFQGPGNHHERDFAALSDLGASVHDLLLSWGENARVVLPSLDLSRTSLRRLKLASARCAQMPVLPSTLQHLDMYMCVFGDSAPCALTCAVGLPRLSSLQYVSVDDTLPPGLLGGLCALRHVDLTVNALAPGTFAGRQGLRCVRASFDDPTAELASLRALACFAPVALIVSLWAYDELIWAWFPDCLVKLTVNVRFRGVTRETGCALAGLGLCRRLRYLSVTIGHIASLEGLRGHPALEELHVFGDGPLDVSALWTCPRLLAVDVSRFTVPPGQMHDLAAYLASQN